jgi:CheY-like chemotaxis protein
MSDLLRRSLGEDIKLEIVQGGGLWKTSVDAGQLEQAILNLAINSRDAMPEGGHLTVETYNASLDDEYSHQHPGVPPGQYIVIAVSDDGVGMPPDVVARAFDPFFTTKGVGKGTGLGLSQVFGFAKQSGGWAKIYSEPRQGTSVKLYFPRYHGPDPQDEDSKVTEEFPRSKPDEYILVVEDEEKLRNLSVEALRELGYCVVDAANGHEALSRIERMQDVTLLFTDTVMPDMNGRELADALGKLKPGLKVLFTTGYARNAIVHDGKLDAGVHLLEKPFTISQLAAKVRQVLDQPHG